MFAHRDRKGRTVTGEDLFGPTLQVAGAGVSPAGRPRLPIRLMVSLLYLKHSLIERALGGELSYHLGYKAGQPKSEGEANHRNGHSGKTVLTDDGPLRVAVPRDREGSFEPALIPKHERRSAPI